MSNRAERVAADVAALKAIRAELEARRGSVRVDFTPSQMAELEAAGLVLGEGNIAGWLVERARLAAGRTAEDLDGLAALAEREAER